MFFQVKSNLLTKNCEKSTREKGFTIIELIVSMLIFLVVTASVYGLLQVGRIDRNRASRRADVLKNARLAVHLIGRDALNAGLGFHRRGAVVPDDFLSNNLQIPIDKDTERDVLTSIIAGNDIFKNKLLADPQAKTDLIAFAFRDVEFNAGKSIDLKTVAAVSGQPAVAQLQTNLTNGAANARRNDLFLVESDTSQVAVLAGVIAAANKINVAPGDKLGLNQPLNIIGETGSMLRKCVSSADEDCTTYLAAMKRFFWISYKVKEDGTLVRILYGNNRAGTDDEQIQEQPLAYNVENFQIRYVLENGTVIDNPSAGDDNIAGTVDDNFEALNLIRQLIVTVTVQSTETDEQTKKPITVTLNATFSTRNLEYDAG